MLKQVRIPRVYSLVVEQIRELIESGQLKPGDKLPTERSLAEQLGVSRSSVREALSALEVLGVINSRQGLGNYVANNVSSILNKLHLTQRGQAIVKAREAGLGRDVTP